MKNFVFLVFVGFLVWLYFYLSIANYSPPYVSISEQILTPPSKKIDPEQEIFSIIHQINEQNNQIQTFICDDVTIKISGFRVSGFLAFEKSQRFRFTIESFFSKELDIGSNDNYFWIWSKESNLLRYVRHDQIFRSKLKTPLNPEWLIQSINLGTIEEKNLEIKKIGEDYHLHETKKSQNGEQIQCVTVINKNLIVGHFLYNSQKKLIASSQILSFQKSKNILFPKTILVNWPEEKIQLEWTLNNPKINIPLSKNYWLLPNYRNAKNMATDQNVF